MANQRDEAQGPDTEKQMTSHTFGLGCSPHSLADADTSHRGVRPARAADATGQQWWLHKDAQPCSVWLHKGSDIPASGNRRYQEQLLLPSWDLSALRVELLQET